MIKITHLNNKQNNSGIIALLSILQRNPLLYFPSTESPYAGATITWRQDSQQAQKAPMKQRNRS